MNIYIAMLRGINVSGQKKIIMAELIAHLEELNFENIQTYIQSGNVIFEKDNTTAEELEIAIADKIMEKYGFEVPVLIKTPEELEYVLANNPFINKQNKDPKRIYVTFLSEDPPEENIPRLSEVDYNPEEFILDGTTIYFYSPDNYGNAKMNNNFFEKKLKVSATTRNWNTVNKLVEMAL